MNKQTIDSEIYNRLKVISKLKGWNVAPKLKEYLDTVKPKTSATGQQRKALHVDCQIIADKLNDAGKDMREVIKQEIEIPWTMLSVKEFIFKPIMKAMFQIESTTELTKNEQQIDKIHQVIMRELGTKYGIEYHDFPSKGLDTPKLDYADMQESGRDYPKNDLDECEL